MSESSSAIRVFLVEDHRTVRLVLDSYLGKQKDMDLVAEAHSAREALQKLPDVGADVVLVDLSLEEMSGVELIAHLRERVPDLLILVLTGHTGADYARKALDAGADGYVIKGDMEQVPTAVRAVYRGDSYVSPSVRDELEGS